MTSLKRALACATVQVDIVMIVKIVRIGALVNSVVDFDQREIRSALEAHDPDQSVVARPFAQE